MTEKRPKLIQEFGASQSSSFTAAEAPRKTSEARGYENTMATPMTKEQGEEIIRLLTTACQLLEDIRQSTNMTTHALAMIKVQGDR